MAIQPVTIIGGGIAGLISSILLARQKIGCIVIEKRRYPFHRVCGEYISNETIPFLQSNNLYPTQLSPVDISEFQLSSVSGKSTELKLDLGGVGISRYSFDAFLYEKAKASGVSFILDTEVTQINYREDEKHFEVATPTSVYTSNLVIGAFGKRSKLDASLSRSFFSKRSPFVGVKYHVRTQHPAQLIALHNFTGGYCGISNVENGISNLCYLTHRENVRKFKNISQMEEGVLFKNPHLKRIFENSEFIFTKPETVNEISFETKEPVWNHILMTGDAAGMITPLCGNGIAMAIHSAKILADLIGKYVNSQAQNRAALEETYKKAWNKEFASRLWRGRLIQNHLFGSSWSSNLAISLAILSKAVAQKIIQSTHGEPF